MQMQTKTIDELVFDAQNQKNGAMEKVLTLYGWNSNGEYTHFLGKYLELFLYGKVNLKDKDTRRFLQLYIKDKTIRSKLTYHYQDYVGSLAGQEMATYLQNKVSQLSKEDLEQELTILLIETVLSYKKTKEKIDFSGYLYNTYRFRVYRMLRKRIFKYEVLNHEDLFTFEEDLETELQDAKAIIEPQESWFDRLSKTNPIHHVLIQMHRNGRCGFLFEQLSVFERTILRDRYFYNKTDGQIAADYGYHINTIYNRRHKALIKLNENKKESLS